jgi:hypothetical protein
MPETQRRRCSISFRGDPGSSAIIIAFALVFGGIVLALAIAFGFGGRDIAREYLEKKMQGKGEEEEDEINHL